MRRLLACALALALPGCAAPLFGDGTSISVGLSGRGMLRRGAVLPERGDGYLIPPTWFGRGSNYGTDELVAAIVRAARRTARRVPGATLYVGDLSRRGGGSSREHRSHHSGRDADLIFYARSPDGRFAPPPPEMPRYDPRGELKGPAGVSPRRFDPLANWVLVRNLLTDPRVEVQWLFVKRELKDLMLEAAAAEGEPPELVERARELLSQPSDSASHDDHLHLRIYCPGADRTYGCVDFGPVRWLKKHLKYRDQVPAELPDALASLLDRLRLSPIGL